MTVSHLDSRLSLSFMDLTLSYHLCLVTSILYTSKSCHQTIKRVYLSTSPLSSSPSLKSLISENMSLMVAIKSSKASCLVLLWRLGFSESDDDVDCAAMYLAMAWFLTMLARTMPSMARFVPLLAFTRALMASLMASLSSLISMINSI